ncbi:UNVERIFIED_CONTAM: hypothetical protein HDU68_010770 [Siphonaria sp. JEL0065]|nr:hypothetical protein HDU68_010770 [Siphonaria sp. JEL0065]
MARTYDIVLFGATGFTGKLAYEHLILKGPLSLKLAIAGRSRTKLEAVRDAYVAGLPEGPRKTKAQGIPILIADSSDQASLDTVASSTKVILSTVGPFLKFGKPLVDSCICFGTDYIDSTGETPFIRDLIDQYHATATEKNIRIVPSCGFDSLPSDILAFLIADYFKNLGKETTTIRGVVTDIKGGISGGTLHTIANIIETTSLAKLASGGPLSLVTNNSRPVAVTPTVLAFNKDLKRYETPWAMGAGNTAYVNRTFSLFEGGYGSKFQYTESLGIFTNVVKAFFGGVLSTIGVVLVILFPPTRYLIKRLVPQGTNTSSIEELKKAHATLKAIGTANDGTKAIAKFESFVDIGYVGTGVMLAESALCLALDDKELHGGNAEVVGSFGVKKGGVLTSVSAMGLVLVRRLKAAGFEIEIHGK